MASEPLLDVVVVPYRCRELLRRCLDSLREHGLSKGGIHIHVVDNASNDGTTEMCRAEFPEVTLTTLDHNSGFAAANNVGLRRAHAPFVLLLNPDTEVCAGALDHMVDLMRQRPDIGMAGCRLVRPDGSFDHAAKRSFPTPAAALAHFTGVGRRVQTGPLAAYRAPGLGEHDAGPVEAINGAFMLVRAEALRDVGLLDEGYWLYMEDLDWCYRFHQKGWGIWYDGGATVIHVKGGTSGARRAARQNVAFHRGMGRFYRKYYDSGRSVAALAVYGGIGVKLAISLTRNAVSRGLPG